MTNPSKTRGVERGAGADEIKRAYRELAKKLHPDLNPGNSRIEQKFKEVSHAYSILGDADKRRRFDRGEIDASGQATGWKGGFYRDHAQGGRGSKYRSFDFGADLNDEDIVTELFGGRARKARRRGADVSYTAPVDFLDAATGA